jgi:hypothetical protein
MSTSPTDPKRQMLTRVVTYLGPAHRLHPVTPRTELAPVPNAATRHEASAR